MSLTQSGKSPAAATSLAGIAGILFVLPVFLTGALAAQLTQDLAFSAAGLGLAVATFRGTAALFSVHFGRLADRLGAIWSLRLSATVSALSCLGISIAATNLWTLSAWMMLGACASALGLPTTNRLVMRAVQPARQGLAFGIKQSATPLASLLGGLSVPLIAVRHGWQWAYLIGIVLGVTVIVLAGIRRPAHQRPEPHRATRSVGSIGPTVVLLSLSFGLATAASSSVPVFFVDHAVRAGTPSSVAGLLLATGSGIAIMVRIGTGVLCDRRSERALPLAALLLGLGSVGLLSLSFASGPALAVAFFVAAGGAWGFNATYWYAVARVVPDSPATVSGAVRPGGEVGATVGPILFGGLAQAVGYSASWIVAAILALLAALAMTFSGHRVAALGDSNT